MKKLCLALFLGCCIFQSAIVVAKHVLPVFSGYFVASGWAYGYFPDSDICTHDSSIVRTFVNACGYAHFSHCPYERVLDEKAAAAALFNDVIPLATCTWDKDFHFSQIQSGIVGFPGTYEDWLYIDEKNPGKFGFTSWVKNCRNSHGESVTMTTVLTWPIFQCPDGSRFAAADKDDGVLAKMWGYIFYGDGACATKPTSGCLGDVVGRDLDSHGFGSLGHVGIVSSIPRIDYHYPLRKDQVIEALDAKPVIQENTADSFESLTKYWGARYGVQNVPLTQDLPWDIAQSIVDNIRMIKKKAEECPDGVKFDWKPGKQHLTCQFEPEFQGIVAVVRCDFLVNEAYKATAGVGQIVDYGLTTTPGRLFSNLLLGRFDADHPQNYPIVKTDPKAELERLQRKLDHASWYLTERYMEDALAGVGSYDILTATVLFQQNNLEPNIEKARFLWNLALKYRDDEDGFKFRYLISGATDLGIDDAELADEMINEYYRQTNVHNKLTLLQDVGGVAPAHFVGGVRQINEKIKELYDDIILHETNLDILSYAAIRYPLLSYEEYLMLIDQVFERPDVGEALKKKMFMTEEVYSVQVRRILSNFNLQKKYLKDFIDQVEKYGDKRFLTVTLCNVFVTYHDPLNNQGWTIDFDPAKLDDSVRPILLDYLKANIPDPFGNEFSSFGRNDRIYYQWLRTYIAVQSKTLDESLKRTADYIKALDDLPLKALLLRNADDTLYKTQFSNEELEALLKTFKEKTGINMLTIKNGGPVLNKNYMRPNREMLFFDGAVGSLEGQIKKRSFNH